MKKTAIFLTLALMLLSGDLMAQSGKAFGGFGYYQPGVQFYMPKNLNDYLPDTYPDVSFSPFMDMGGGFGVFYNIVFGFDGGAYTGGTFVKDNRKVELSGEYGTLKLGYVVYKKHGLLVYPSLGYSENIISLFLHGTDETQSFEAITANPEIATTLLYKNRTAIISLACQYFVVGSKTDEMRSGFAIGLEVGYQLPPFSHGIWTYDNGAVMDGPQYDLSGFFIRLSIGGGGIMIR